MLIWVKIRLNKDAVRAGGTIECYILIRWLGLRCGTTLEYWWGSSNDFHGGLHDISLTSQPIIKSSFWRHTLAAFLDYLLFSMRIWTGTMPGGILTNTENQIAPKMDPWTRLPLQTSKILAMYYVSEFSLGISDSPRDLLPLSSPKACSSLPFQVSLSCPYLLSKLIIPRYIRVTSRPRILFSISNSS